MEKISYLRRDTDLLQAVEETEDHMLEEPAADLVLSLETKILITMKAKV